MAVTTVATPGHFDELRGAVSEGDKESLGTASSATNSEANDQFLTPAWRVFFENFSDDTAADFDQRASNLERQIKDNGVTYNVYADENGPQRPWSLDLFPLIIEPESWEQIEQGVRQRMRLLERIMADVYSHGELLAQGLLPPALVYGHPGYLRAMHGVTPVGGTHLHLVGFDLARGPDGNWWVMGQRCQAPSGLGYLLENRLAISGQFPQAFQSMQVQRLAGTYQALMDSLRRMSPAGAEAHLALLTPGPYNETYFEHAYLARYLGLSLVEGSDLLVRDERLYLKTLKGLVPVDILLKRVDDQYMDPLELRPDSTLGVPGLLQAVRAGNVLVANAPGSAFLESPALLGFLPAMSRHLLGEELLLPALPTWWCGERSAMEQALPQLGDCAIKPTYPDLLHGNFEAVLGRSLLPREQDEWAGRIMRQGEDHTVQAYLPLSQVPTWQAGKSAQASSVTGRKSSGSRIVPRSVMLRVFAVSDGPRSWRVLPGGLARVASADAEIASMQRGGSSADVWALTRGEVDRTTLLHPRMTPDTLAHRKRMVTSRAAENLYWLGRYTERTENSIRLARITLECLNGENQSSLPLMTWLGKMAVSNTLVVPGVPSASQARRVFERSLISSLGSTEGATSVGYNLRALKLTAASVRERLSQEHWRVIVTAEENLFSGFSELMRSDEYSSPGAQQILRQTSAHMAAITGAQTDRMTRDDGWRLLSVGRQIERLGFLSNALSLGFQTGSVHTHGGFDAMIAMFDSTITFHALFQQSRDLAAMLDLLVLDQDNPRSLALVVRTLRDMLDKLRGDDHQTQSGLWTRLPDPSHWKLMELCETHPPLGTQEDPAPWSSGYFFALNELLLNCAGAAFNISDDISARYFTHSGRSNQSVGTK